MNRNIDELLARIHALQDELDEEYRKTRDEWAQPCPRRPDGAAHLRRLDSLPADGPVRHALPGHLLPDLPHPQGAPRRLPVFDRQDLPYLNIIEKFNCFYCSYGNGIAAYTREVAARTEQYWCPIKHARRVRAAHDYYPKFADYGDAEAFQQGLNRLRRQYDDVEK